MKVLVKCGQQEQVLELCAGDEDCSSEALKTFGDLKAAVISRFNLDLAKLKIIKETDVNGTGALAFFRSFITSAPASRTLAGDDSTALSTFGFKENEILRVMGTAAKFFIDAGWKELGEYEKKHLISMQETLSKIEEDLSGLEKGFLQGAQRDEMIKKMDKRIRMFNEVGTRHLEGLDAIRIQSETTTPEQGQRNREKRKSLIDGIEILLNRNDKNAQRLSEYQTACVEQATAAT